MNTTESILTLCAVAVLGYWWGQRRATAAATASAQSQNNTNGLDWLGSWASA